MFNGGFIKRDHSTTNLINNPNLAPSIPFSYQNFYTTKNHNPLPPLYKDNTSLSYKQDLNNLEKQVSGYNKLNINNYFPKVPLSGYTLEDTHKLLQKGKEMQQHQYDQYFANEKEKKQIMNDMHSKLKLLGRSPLEEEYKKLFQPEDHKTWKTNLMKEMNEAKNEIKSQLEEEMKRGNTLSLRENKELNELTLDNINRSLLDLKNDLSSQLFEFDKKSKNTFEDIKSSLAESNEKQIEYLVDKLFPNKNCTPAGQGLDIQRQKGVVYENKNKQVNNNSQQKQQQQQPIRLSMNKDNSNNTKEKLEESGNEYYQNELLYPIPENECNRDTLILPKPKQQFKPRIRIDPNNMVNSLDLRKRYLEKQLRTHAEVTHRLNSYSHFCEKRSPISKFRSYVYFMIAAKRLRNIQYIIYSRFKFNSVHYFINNYEDMDIIIKKLMYRSIRSVVTELITDEYLDINISYEKSNSHSLFLILKELLELIINALTTDFAKGVSGSMLTFLSLFISNYSYIPSSFFTTFELVRFRTTPTGEFINLQRDQQIMILGFYLFFKILLKSIFLELTFNEESIPNLSRRCKLNIKMIVSVIYRGLIEQFKKCPRQRNINEIELREGFTNYREIGYVKKEFDIDWMTRRRKKKVNREDSLESLGKKYYRDRYLYRIYKEGLNDERKEDLELPPLMRKEGQSKPVIKKKKLKRCISLPEVDSQQQSPIPKTNETSLRVMNGKMKRNEEEFVDWMNKKQDKAETARMNSKIRGEEEGTVEEMNNENDNNANVIPQNKKRRRRKKNALNRNNELENQLKADLLQQQQEDNKNAKIANEQYNSKVKGKRIAKGKGQGKNQVIGENENINQSNEIFNQSKTLNARSKKTRSSNKRKQEPKAPRMPPPNPELNPNQKPKKSKKTQRKIKQVQQEEKEVKGENDLEEIYEEQEEQGEEQGEKNDKVRLTKPGKNDASLLITNKPKRKKLNASKSQNVLNASTKLKGKAQREVELIEPNPMILTNENKWLYKAPVFAPEFTQDEIKTIKYIFKEMPQYGEDSDQNEFELIDRIVYQPDSLQLYELFKNEYEFDPITPLMLFLEDLLDLILTHFNQDDD